MSKANQKKANAKRDQELTRIAMKFLDLDTLETRGSGDQDFREHAVWCIEMALQAAYEAGRNAK